MKDINITVLFVESIPSRIYIAMLLKHGLRPKKIIYLNIETSSRKFKIAKKILGSWIVSNLYKKLKSVKTFYSSMRPEKYGNSAKFNYEVENLSKKLIQEFDLTYSNLQFKLQDLVSEFEKVTVSGFDDLRLISLLDRQENKTFLFTGGGMLKPKTLSIKGSHFIHIHPGIVPEVKGADCFFWSYLLRGKLGYSIFYMNQGVDTGDVLHKKEYQFNYNTQKLGNYSHDVIYRSILQVCDPALRILTFIDLIKGLDERVDDLGLLSYEKQDSDEGRTYFYMHKTLRDFVINKFNNRQKIG
jgi:formyl transferase-like protein